MPFPLAKINFMAHGSDVILSQRRQPEFAIGEEPTEWKRRLKGNWERSGSTEDGSNRNGKKEE